MGYLRGWFRIAVRLLLRAGGGTHKHCLGSGDKLFPQKKARAHSMTVEGMQGVKKACPMKSTRCCAAKASSI